MSGRAGSGDPAPNGLETFGERTGGVGRPAPNGGSSGARAWRPSVRRTGGVGRPAPNGLETFGEAHGRGRETRAERPEQAAR